MKLKFNNKDQEQEFINLVKLEYERDHVKDSVIECIFDDIPERINKTVHISYY